MARGGVRRRGRSTTTSTTRAPSSSSSTEPSPATSASGSSSVARPRRSGSRPTSSRACAGASGTSPAAVIPLAYVRRSRRRRAARCSCRRARRGSRRRSTRSTGSSSPAAPTSTRQSTARRRTPRRPARGPSATAASSRCSTAALERDMPVLAVCRGSQVLNVARGGDLVQHLPEVVGDEKHKHTPGRFRRPRGRGEGRQPARLAARRARARQVAPPPGLRDASAKGSSRRRGPTTARSRRSRIPTKRFAVGVLWHPEAGEDAALFEALVDEARAHTAPRGGLGRRSASDGACGRRERRRGGTARC